MTKRLTGLLLATTLLGFAGEGLWVLDLFAHFRFHYLCAALVPAGLLLARRDLRWGTAAALVVALNAGFVAPLWWAPTADGERSLKVLTINVNRDNQDFAAVARAVRKHDPDIVGLVEVHDRWLRELEVTLQTYPYRAVVPRPDNFGVALYSRHPVLLDDLVPQPITGFPTVRAVVEVAGERVQVAVVHLPPPLSAEWSRARDQHLRQFANMRAHSTGRFVLMGDFNATPWSSTFRQLLRVGMRRAGPGVAATWPSRLGPLGIPIDHVLLHGPITARRVEVLDAVGSDHRPLLAELAF